MGQTRQPLIYRDVDTMKAYSTVGHLILASSQYVRVCEEWTSQLKMLSDLIVWSPAILEHLEGRQN